MQVGLWTLARKRLTVTKNMETKSLLFNILAYNNFKSAIKSITFNVKIKVFKMYYSFLNHTFSSPDLYCWSRWIFCKFLRNHIWQSASFKNVKTLNNVTSFSKLSHGHFPANVTKFSQQLSLTPSSSYIVNEKIRTHVKVDNILLWKLQVYLKTWFSLSQFS